MSESVPALRAGCQKSWKKTFIGNAEQPSRITQDGREISEFSVCPDKSSRRGIIGSSSQYRSTNSELIVYSVRKGGVGKGRSAGAIEVERQGDTGVLDQKTVNGVIALSVRTHHVAKV